MSNKHATKILILDFGSQTTQLIARRIRELGVYSEIHPFDWPLESIHAFNPSGIILSGGPESVSEYHSPRAPEGLFKLKIPILGICYGMQTMAVQLGGEVSGSAHREFGDMTVTLERHHPLLADIEDSVDADGKAQLNVWMSHGDQVTRLPEGFVCIATTETCPIAAMAHQSLPLLAVQFHPEVQHTLQGTRIIEHFVKNICHCEANWTAEHIIERSIHEIRKQVGREHVVLGLSGGVDSSVVAALLHRAIGKQLTCVFVDTGLLRMGEGDAVMKTMHDNMGIHIIRVDAEDRFMQALMGVDDPEAKRKIIGRVFVDIFQEEAQSIEGAAWLAQGTIYPDVVESAATAHGKSHVIKSHHNVGGLPDTLKLKLIEPLRELFKDEVRALGLALGLPHDMVYRHPFPGPGLAVRILGEVKKEYCDILRQADAIFMQALRDSGWYEKTAQAFAVFLPVKSVAVMGDARVYDYVIALRAVETIDFMTARWAQLPYELLAKVSNRICNEVRGVSRVTYDISSKPPATIEWE